MVKMEALRALYESLGLKDPQTYVQSGNVVFRTKKQDLAALSKRISNAIERSFGFRTPVIVRTTSELRNAIAKNPFERRSGIDPSRLLVTFLAEEPVTAARDLVLNIKTEPEELHIHGREVYMYFPNGMARPKVSWVAIEKKLKASGTGRNWNSVTKLLEIAERLEADD
jgi:uncharacterized protein (DUF1697 family)